MGFERGSPAPERFFLYGPPGAGKSSAAFSIARKYAKTHTPGKIHLIDSDNAYFDNIDEYPEAEGIILPTIVDTSEEGGEWEEMRDAIAKAIKDADPDRGDWIVVDRCDPAWEWAQDSYAREVKGTDIDTMRAEGRKKVESGEDKNLRAGATGFEWAEIKSRFRKPFMRLSTSGCNVIITAGETKLSQYTDQSGEQRELFGGLPVRPAGGAGTLILAHMFRDIIHLRCTSIKKELYFASAAKARGRKVKLDNTKIRDFSWDVLIKMAGWRVRGAEEEEVDES